MQHLFWLFWIGLVLLSESTLSETLTIRYRPPESVNDHRQNYNMELLHLALTKTRSPHEQIKFEPIPPVGSPRARFMLNNNSYPNLILELTYDDSMSTLSNIDYAVFPIELGVMGYRTCFVSHRFQQTQRKIDSLEELKSKTYAAGTGWPDAIVLKDNQFHVVEVNQYENIFKMLVNDRFDLFCRGVNEIFNESKTFGQKYQLVQDQDFVIHYPLPRFFFVHKSNQALKNRLEKGLKIAFNDGSLIKLWRQHFAESIRFSDIAKRKLFELENKRIAHINREYEQYLLPLYAY